MLNKKLKKVIAGVTMFASVVCLSGVSMLAPLSVKAATTIVDGDIVKSNAVNSDGTPAISSLDVYIVKIVGTKMFKRLVLNPEIFESYGHLNWENLKVVSQAEIDAYTTSSLVRVDGNDKVYAITPVTGGDTGAKSWINVTAAQFLSLPESDPDSIYTINNVDGAAYSVKTDITTVAQLTSFYADGTLPTEVATGSVTASLSATTPASGSVVTGQALADLAHFKFAGKGSVTKVVLQRFGVSANADVNNVYLFEGNTRLTDARSFNADSTVTFNNASGIFSVDGSKTISVRADIDSSATGTIGAKLNSFSVADTASATNLSGNLMSIVSQSNPATASFAANAVSAQEVDAGTTNFTVWSSPLTVNTRTLNLEGMTFRFIGSAPTDSLENISLYVNGTKVGTSGTVNSLGNIVFDLGSEAIALKTGTATIDLRADVIKGSNREFQISVQNVADIMLADTQLDGVYVAAANVATNGIAGTITVKAGSVAVNVDSTLSGTITGGATGVSIAKYEFKAYGEDMKVSSLIVNPILADVLPATPTTLSNVMLYADGGQVGTSQNFTTGTPLTFNLGSSLIIPAGTTVIVEVKADTMTTGSVAYTGGTISVALSGATSNAQGIASSKLSQVPAAAVTSTALSIGTASGSVSVNSGYTNQVVAPSAQKTKIGSFIIQSGSTEGVKVTNLQVGLTFGAVAPTMTAATAITGAGQTITPLTGIANIAVGDTLTFPAATTAGTGTVTAVTATTFTIGTGTASVGDTTGVITGATGPMTITNVSNLYTSENATPIAPSGTNNFPVNFTLAASASKTIDVFADLSTLKAGTITTSLKITAISDETNTSLASGNGIASALTGQTITVAQGTLSTPPTLTASMPAQFVIGGSTLGDFMTINFVASNGAATVKELKFTVTGTATAPIASIAIGSVSAPVIGGVAHLSGLSLAVPAGYNGLDVKVVPTFNTVGLGGQTSNTTADVKLSYMKYTIGNTTTENSTVTTPIAKTMTIVASKPTVTLNTSSRTGLANTLVKLMDVTVTADAAGSIKLQALPVTVTSTGAVTIVSAANNLVVKDAQGAIILTTNAAGIGVAARGSGSDTILFSTPDMIAAGTSKVYSIYGTAATVAVDNKLSSTLGAATAFLFTDVNGNVQSIPGKDATNTNIINYPTESSSIES
ncbi:MAG: hypothetical protein PHX30_03615 [Candidatus Pacebacteria bacterium]|nr:hypothetical protein [Candidatus Paceibacterota bacterium]